MSFPTGTIEVWIDDSYATSFTVTDGLNTYCTDIKGDEVKESFSENGHLLPYKRSKEKMIPRGICKFCGCTDNHACITEDGPCYWMNEEEDICSACHSLFAMLSNEETPKII